MSDVPEPNGTVSYSVKELLARQDGKLDSILIALNTKAERNDLSELSGRVTVLERTDSKQEGSNYLFWRGATLLVSVAALALAVVVALR